MTDEIVNNDNVIADLYMMLDNVATLAGCDWAKGNYEAFYKAAIKEAKKRDRYFKLFESIINEELRE